MIENASNGISVENFCEEALDRSIYHINSRGKHEIVIFVIKIKNTPDNHNSIAITVKSKDPRLETIEESIEEASNLTNGKLFKSFTTQKGSREHSFSVKFDQDKYTGRAACEECLNQIVTSLLEKHVISGKQAQYIWDREETTSYFSKDYPETNPGFTR